MLRMRNDETIKVQLQHKPVQLLRGDASICQVKLLEDAGMFKAGTELTAFCSQIEEYDETTGTSRFYDPSFAEALDEKLNQPYETIGIYCSHKNCDNESGFNYEMTGYVVNDQQGIYVEKKCERCGTITTDGDGDFHSYFRIKNGDIIRNVERNNDAIDERLFMHYDNGDTPELEKGLHELVDNYAKQFKPKITDDERDFVVRRTIEYIDEETQSIDACLCDHLSGLDE